MKIKLDYNAQTPHGRVKTGIIFLFFDASGRGLYFYSGFN